MRLGGVPSEKDGITKLECQESFESSKAKFKLLDASEASRMCTRTWNLNEAVSQRALRPEARMLGGRPLQLDSVVIFALNLLSLELCLVIRNMISSLSKMFLFVFELISGPDC